MISTDDIRQILGGNGNKVDKKVWEDLIKEVDENGDGHVLLFSIVQDISTRIQRYDVEDLMNIYE